MKWNAFNLATPAIDKTTELLFPIKVKYWLKLGFVSLLSVGNSFGSGGNSSPNINLPTSSKDASNITGNAVSNLSSKIGWTFMGLFALIALIIALILKFITSVFTFIFIDALVKKDYTIGQSWRDNKSRGLSFFGFRIITGLIFLAVTALIFVPLIIQLLQSGFTNFFENTPLLTIFLTFIPSILLFILWAILYGVFMTFFIDFALPEMYKTHVCATEAMKRTYKILSKQKLEAFVYILAKIVFSLVVGIIAMLTLLVYALAALIVTGILALIIILPLYFISKVAMIAVAIIIGIPYVIFLLYVFIVVILPLSTFKKYFSLIGYEKVFNTRLLKK